MKSFDTKQFDGKSTMSDSSQKPISRDDPSSFPMHAPTWDCEQALAAALDDEYDFPVNQTVWISRSAGKESIVRTWLQRVMQAAVFKGRSNLA